MHNNLKILIRNLYRNALYTWINIVGLAVSLTAAIFILIWVQDELGYDKSYSHINNIYRPFLHLTADLNNMSDGMDHYLNHLPPPFVAAMNNEIAEVQAATFFTEDWELDDLDYQGQKYFNRDYEYFFMTDAFFFQVFDIEFIEGDAKHAFPDPHGIVITADYARLIFGEDSALGKVLKGNNGNDYHVTGVVKKMAQNSTFQFKALLSIEQSKYKDRWDYWGGETFVLLNPDADLRTVGDKMKQIQEKNYSHFKSKDPYILQPLAQSHLYAPDGSDTGMKSVRLFMLIAVVLLAIACINYVTLVTARVYSRMKEIGVRKIIGASRVKLLLQVMSETVLLFFIAIIIASILLYMLTPFYMEVSGKGLVFSIFNKAVLLSYLIAFVFVVVLAGVYPAILISSFKPLDVFRTKMSNQRIKFSFRQVLVVLQFACAGAFILIITVMDRQHHFVQTKSLGYNKENIFIVNFSNNRNALKSIDVVKHELAQQPGIAGVTAANANIINIGRISFDLSWSGDSGESSIVYTPIDADRNFFEVMGLKLKEGFGFNGTPADSLCIYINEKALEEMTVMNPIDMEVTYRRKGKKIAGIISNFHFSDFKTSIRPFVMSLGKPAAMNYIYVKTASGKAGEAIVAAEELWKRYDSEYPFEYEFLDETFDKMYREDERSRSLFNAFAGIAIFVSCLGLFGLATYAAETRTKEIGIRKTLGANVSNIVTMLSKEFIVLVGIGLIIGFPIAYYFMEKMLQSYVYRISITWWMVLAAVLIVLILVIATVSAQALRAARANPVKAIKTE